MLAMQGHGLLPPPSIVKRVFHSFFKSTKPNVPRQKVLVLGTGWGAYRFVKSVDCDAYEVVVVSPRNHFLFTPLLASTTVGTLEFRSVVEPIRKTRQNMEYYQAECTDINAAEKKVVLKGVLGGEPFEMKYDKLVVAVGARNNTFNIPGVTEHAYFLKELHHARAIRKHILNCFEQAAMPNVSRAERERLLSFVVVGGGPTGIEFAAELDDLFWEDLTKAFPTVNSVRITLLEASNTVLSSFDASLSEYTMRSFRKRGIDLRTGSLVKEVTKNEVVLSDGSVVPFGLLVWSTGIAPQAFIKDLELPKDRHGRILVDNFLQVKDTPDMKRYALGDCASIENNALPATAQVAQQQASYLAKAFNKKTNDTSVVSPFAYHYMGMLAYVGHYHSVFDTPHMKVSGIAAWISWRSVYLTRLGSLKSKIQVPFEWFRTFVFGRDITSF